jgi:hypothetical protein
MSYLDRIYRGRKHIVSEVVETAEYAGASYGFGYLQNRYREKASVMGVPADLLAGVGLKVVALGCEILGTGRAIAPHASIIGNAGVGAYFHTLGAGAGAKAAGIKRILIPEGDVEKAKKALPNATILGDLGKAPHGDFLSIDELAKLAR